MPTKCMAQIPMPIANAPPDNQYRAAGRCWPRARGSPCPTLCTTPGRRPLGIRGRAKGYMFQRAFLGSCPGRIPPPRRPQFTSIRSQQLQIARRAILAVDAGDSRTLFLYFGRGLRPGNEGDRRGRMSPGRAASDGHGAAGAVRQQRARAMLDARPGLRDGLYRKRAFRSPPIFTSRGHDAAQLRPLALAQARRARPAPFGRPARSLRHGDNRQFGKASLSGPRGGFAGPRRRLSA